MERITDKHLTSLCILLNKLSDITKDSAYIGRDKDNKLVPNAGYYFIDHAYGGVKLSIMCKRGGCDDVLSLGYTTKRDLYNNIHSYLRGFDAGLLRLEHSIQG